MTLLGRWGMVGLVLALGACKPQSDNTDTTTQDKAYKNTFSQNFNQSCYDGFARNFDQRTPPPEPVQYQGAKQICECISYNLVQNNSVVQLEAFSKKTAEEVLVLTRPLVASCSEQVVTKLGISASEPTTAASDAS